MAEGILFDVRTPLNFTVRCSEKWWQYVSTVKHPILEDRLDDVIATLTDPQEIRRSTKDPAVLLFYRSSVPRFLCVVTRQENGEGFLITAYPTDSFKKGEIVWSASE